MTDALVDLHRFLWSTIQTQQQQLLALQERIADLETALAQPESNGHKPTHQEQGAR